MRVTPLQCYTQTRTLCDVEIKPFKTAFRKCAPEPHQNKTRIVFENLSMLQQDIQSSWSLSKRPRDDDRLHLPSTQTQDEDPHLLLPGRRNGTARQLSIDSAHTAPTHHTRHPLRQLDTNCSDINTVRSDQYKYKGTANTCATVPHTHARSQRAKKRAERCRLYKSRKNGSDNCGH
jgi:hypothetical protein